MTAQLAPLDIIAPGRLGLNTEKKGTVLDPAYATKANNCVIDERGLLASRKGWSDQTGTELSSKNIESLHEYIQADASTEMIIAWDGGIANDIDDPAGSDISGAVTDTSGTWWFQNFNDKCLGFQAGQKVIVYTGTGNFATVTESAGTAPTGGVAACAFGRVWQTDSTGTVLTYCDLLDETDWTGGGVVSFNNIWTNGQDRITAVAGFNGNLIVFGMRHIVVLGETTGSAIGLDPANLFVKDVIEGTGCVDQQTVQHIGDTDGDLVFLSPNGVQTLSRIIQEKSNPLGALSRTVRTELLNSYSGATAGTLRSAYSETLGTYILTFSGSKTYAFDIRRVYKDELGVLAPVFTWDLAPYSWAVRENGDILLGSTDKVGKYETTTDDTADIAWLYESGWLDFGEELANRLKILKKIGSVVSTNLGGSIVYKWATDFNTNFDSVTKDLTASANSSEWGVAEWGTAEWSGQLALRIIKQPARDKGQYYKIGVQSVIDTEFALQQLELFTKVGRLA